MRVGIPPDPHYRHPMDESRRPLLTYADLEPQYGRDAAMRRIKEAMEKEDAAYERECIESAPPYEGATDYAASSHRDFPLTEIPRSFSWPTHITGMCGYDFRKGQVFGERHLRHLLLSYMTYCNHPRTEQGCANISRLCHDRAD